MFSCMRRRFAFESESCTLALFKRKMFVHFQLQGECFLFHCGPAQDFRCKFSKHSNYTSAVLSMEKKAQQAAISSKKPINPPTVPLSQSEIELKSLKNKSNDVTPATVATTIKVTAPLKNATSHCGRFQFQCHSGDCIAIYNACDGISQCDDGSDEGPEVNIRCLHEK